MAEMTSDLGGDEVLSEAQRQLIRRAAGLMVQAEATEARIIAGHQIDLGAHVTACNTLRRILDTLGLQRITTTKPLSLAEHLAAQAAQRQQQGS